MSLFLVALLAFALGWVWGHSVARIKVVPAHQDAAACCERWRASAGADHDTTCTRERRPA